MRSKSDQIKIQIKDMLERIEDIDALLAIEQYVKDHEPMTLRTYINVEFDEYSKDIRRALESEIEEIYSEISKDIKPCDKHVTHFCDLYIEGYPLDSWIENNGSLFNAWSLSDIIFKLWTKEIVLR